MWSGKNRCRGLRDVYDETLTDRLVQRGQKDWSGNTLRKEVVVTGVAWDVLESINLRRDHGV